jgi:hypothetical protein
MPQNIANQYYFPAGCCCGKSCELAEWEGMTEQQGNSSGRGRRAAGEWEGRRVQNRRGMGWVEGTEQQGNAERAT